MQTRPLTTKSNPLANFMRQPKIYIKLPSGGEFWPAKSIDIPENGEFPVYSMTARDELLFKTPDALMNGQAIVDVIQSCIPNIKNGWDTPTLDLDAILIAIRLATYGNKMPITHKIPVINEDADFDVDLAALLDQQQNNIWLDQVIISPELIIYVKPLTYKHLTQTSIKSFETARIMNLVNDEKISDEQKVAMFNESFSNLTKVTVELLSESIYKIEAGGEEVTDRKFILDFVQNADKEIFTKVQDRLTELKKSNELKPLEFGTTGEQQEQGAPARYTVPINFNNSDFFGQGS
jgi:hypothetical protein